MSEYSRETCAMVQRLLPYLIQDDSTPVIQGVCAWLSDVGVLDGNDDEVAERLQWMAKEGEAADRVHPQAPKRWLIQDAAAIGALDGLAWLYDTLSNASARLMASKDENDVYEGRCLNDFLIGIDYAAVDSELLPDKEDEDCVSEKDDEG